MQSLPPYVATGWIVARARPTDNPEFVYPGFGFHVIGEDVPPATREGRVIFPATGGTYDPEEYPELAGALAKVGLEPGRLPDYYGRVGESPQEPSNA